MPAFSVIVPAYNGAAMLPRCLASLQSQQFTDWECIIVDDGSTDATPDVIARHAHADSRIRGVRQANAGAAAARNAGIAAARGDWLCFLDCDDYYYPAALATYADVRDTIADHPQQPQMIGGFVAIDISGVHLLEMTGKIEVVDAFATTYGVRRDTQVVFLQPTAFSRALVDRIGRFSTRYYAGEDRDFAIRACAASPVAHVHSVIACYTKAHGMGKSDRYLATGEKLANTRRMYADLDSNPLVTARFGPGLPAHADYVRWRGCHVAMLDCAEAVRRGEFAQAAERLILIQAAAVAREEVVSLVRRLVYFLYYPPNDPAIARPQCSAWLRRLAGELESRGPQNLHRFVLTIAARFDAPADTKPDDAVPQ